MARKNWQYNRVRSLNREKVVDSLTRLIFANCSIQYMFKCQVLMFFTLSVHAFFLLFSENSCMVITNVFHLQISTVNEIFSVQNCYRYWATVLNDTVVIELIFRHKFQLTLFPFLIG